MDKVSFGVANMHCRLSATPEHWDVKFAVFGRGITGTVIVPVAYGLYSGENILKVARNDLRIFSGSLADATAPYALTPDQVTRLRKDYQPDPLLR
ncbi:hypothetical protein [Methylobacterium platani]|uniref:Uncharacterized protein n=2 Tax=Methylobacterium platani TaxID=427683 RepID=A0A179SB26_9HYPH|nr:hypothetical protein [Methylobacterium platani]KMO20900.1 hypothetical protein SQ03_04820 [Methylobacterium platani JCM 14648]OAS24828.1 hypothetical protein A5481_12070 [Methylobacterium platani]